MTIPATDSFSKPEPDLVAPNFATKNTSNIASLTKTNVVSFSDPAAILEERLQDYSNNSEDVEEKASEEKIPLYKTDKARRRASRVSIKIDYPLEQLRSLNLASANNNSSSGNSGSNNNNAPGVAAHDINSQVHCSCHHHSCHRYHLQHACVYLLIYTYL